MPRKQGHERAHGPYQHGNRWQVVIVGADGKRALAKERDDGPSSFESREAALAFIEGFRGAADARTLGEAVTAFVAARCNTTESSAVTAKHRLVGLLRLTAGDRLLSNFKAATAVQLVRQRQLEVSYETLRGELGYATRLGAWCTRQGWMRINPFEDIELDPPKERNRGKPQLRVDEVRRFLGATLADASPEATAVLMTLLMGLRAHEVVERVVRDVDDNGRLLVIGKSKTRAGVRTVAIPAMLRDRLLALTDGRGPAERIFSTRTNSRGRGAIPMTRYALHYHVVRLAAAAGVPRVTPHGLRGSWASMALSAQLPGGFQMSVEQVAKAMGHAGTGVTQAHYLRPGAVHSANVTLVEEFLQEGDEQDQNARPHSEVPQQPETWVDDVPQLGVNESPLSQHDKPKLQKLRWEGN